jgi:hypothetical protein
VEQSIIGKPFKSSGENWTRHFQFGESTFDAKAIPYAIVSSQTEAEGYFRVTSTLIQSAFARLHGEIARLEIRVAELETALQYGEAPVTEVKKSPGLKKLKAELLAYFRKHPNTYPSDAAFELGYDSKLVFLTCQALMREGLIGG